MCIIYICKVCIHMHSLLNFLCREVANQDSRLRKTLPEALGKWIQTGIKNSEGVKLGGCYDDDRRK